jgi:hypothetical protein
MDEIPYEVFLNIGKQLVSNENNVFDRVYIETKPFEEYKSNYINNLEVQIARLKKELFQLEVEILELERKNIILLTNFSRNSKYKSNTMNFLYNNNVGLTYFLSLKTLESKKFKLNSLTIENLKGQYETTLDIYNKTLVLLQREK